MPPIRVWVLWDPMGVELPLSRFALPWKLWNHSSVGVSHTLLYHYFNHKYIFSFYISVIIRSKETCFPEELRSLNTLWLAVIVTTSVSLSLWAVRVMPFPILNLITVIHLTQVLQEMGCVCESQTWITSWVTLISQTSLTHCVIYFIFLFFLCMSRYSIKNNFNMYFSL